MTAQPTVEIPFSDLPEGTVTFLFSDIVGSTKLLYQLGDQFTEVLAEHHRILREAVGHYHGQVVRTEGDAFFVAFPRATDAVAATVEAQLGLARHPWPEGVDIRVRMGMHTGEPEKALDDYVGIAVHRAARIAHVGHGGQVLLSETTTALVGDELPEGVSLFDLGRHLLKDIHRPERICQLVIEGLPAEFPPLNTLEALPPEGTRLPRPVGECPYRGLSAFQEVDAPFYFGREDFVTALDQAVRTKKLVAVIVGSSGSGKSSALFAGLIPRLREAGGYQFASFRPGSRPFYALAGALLPLLESGLSETDQLAETRKLAERLQKGGVRLSEVTGRILEKTPETSQILLIADQFEELYTLCPEVELQEAFIDELLAAVEEAKSQQDVSSVILLTLRADFMGQALAHRSFADALQEASLLMGPMTRQELHMAIEKPAEMQGAAFEAGLVERILDDVGQKPGNLPLLEFTLTLLWEGQTDGWLTHANYEAMGSVEGALAAYADQVYGGMETDDQERTRRALVQLVQPGEGTEDTRRIATREELGDESWSLIQRLADKRLVVTGRDAAGQEIAEVIHEALIQKWGRFQEWMDADRAFRAWQERLRVNLRQWQESGQDEGALLSGAPLALAQNWLDERGDYISPVEIQYIEASLARQARLQQEQQRRRRLTILGLAAGLVIAITLAAVAFYQRQNSMRQAAVLLASQAESELEEGNTDRAVLLALEALENYPYTSQAEHALGQAVSYNRALQQYTGHEQAVTSVAWSPDGTRIASSSTDNSVHVWDPITGEDLLVIDLPEGITGNYFDWALTVKWSPDGEHLLTISGDRWKLGSQDYDLILWDALSGEQLKAVDIPNRAEPEEGELTTGVTNYATANAAAFAPESGRLATLGGDNTALIWDASLQGPELTLSGHENDVNAVAWSLDEALLATVSEDGTARIWDADTGEELLMLQAHEGGVNAVVWSPDGAQLATAGDDGTIRIWDAGTGKIVDILDPLAGIVWSLAWSPDGRYLVTGTDDAVIRIWDIENGEVIAELKGHTAFIAGLAWSPVDDRLASSDAKNAARIWNAALNTAAQILPYSTVSDFDWSSDGRYLALPAGDPGWYTTKEPGALAIWDAYASQPKTDKLDVDFNYALMEADYSPGDEMLLVRGLSSWPEGIADMGAMHVLNSQTGKLVKSFKVTDSSWIRSSCWSTDGTRVAGGTTNGVLYIWDYQTGELLNTLEGHKQEGMMINYVEWSPDGTEVATASDDGTARVWNADTGETLLVLAHEQPTVVWTVAWSPDGARLLTTSGNDDKGAADTTIRVWDAKNGEELLVISGHTGQVSMADWSPDGKRIVSASSDGTTRIWDEETGDELLRLSTPAIYFMTTQWSPDGRYIAVGMEETPMEVWRVWQTTEELIDYAKECCVFRELTSEEREQFGLPER